MVEYLLATDEQRELAGTALQICEKLLAPKLEEYENANNGVGQYPWEVHHALAEAGYYCMNMPEEYGGLALNSVTRGIIMEEMSRVDCAFPFSFRGLGDKFNLITRSHIPEADKQMWLEKMLAGQAGGAFGLTEPMAGTDSTAIRTTAVKDGDEWVINGSKCFITNASISDFYGIYAWTDKSVSAGKGITLFLVEKGTPGITIHDEKKMGFKLSPTGDLVLEDVRVPDDHVVGEVGRGFKAGMDALGEARPFNAVFCIGAAQQAIDVAKKYANERCTWGTPIINHQAVGFQLAEMQMKLDAARAMVYTTLEAVDRGIDVGPRYASGTKAQCTQMCQEIAIDAIQILGGYGYMKEYPLEKIARDLRLFTIFAGTNEIQKEIIRRTMVIKK